ncbi:MAG: NmrA family NAD(P)-binding protein, partial [Sinobacteraceae bacterium]|nr:NmrA family NAD(P)-binding protein [Nevskiaceae bacterium]
MSSPDLLVTGASGQFGQRVVHHLLETLQVPAARIIAASRNPESLGEWRAKGITTRPADFDDPASLSAAFAAVERVLLISTDALDRPGHRLAQHKAAVEAAVKANVKHIIYTSMPKPQGSPLLFAPDHAGTEAALAASSLPEWTVLRNNWYFENLLRSLPSTLKFGKWFTATGEGRVAYIARDDLARAAATALAGKTKGKTTLTLSGGQAYSVRELARLISQSAGKPIEVVPVSVDQLVQGMVTHGVPEALARVLASIDTNTAAGR